MRRNGRLLAVQLLLALMGTGAFCLYSHSWFDAIHLVYDIPAGLCTFGFIAQLVVETQGDEIGPFLLYRIAVVLAMTVATVGRQYLGWNISGHLSCVLAIALIQTTDKRLESFEQCLYWLPVFSVLYLRITFLELPHHTATYYAVTFAVICVIPALVMRYVDNGSKSCRTWHDGT